MNQEPEIIKLKAPDGTDLPVRIFKSDNKHKKTLIFFPGMGVPVGYYDPFANELKSLGYNVISCEIRGQGDSRPKPNVKSKYGYHEIACEDMPIVLNLAKKLFPDTKIYFCAHSIGGQIGLLFATRYKSDLDGLIFIASGLPYYKDYPLAYSARILAAIQGVKANLKIYGYKPVTMFENYGPQSKNIMSDWIHLASTGQYKIKNDNFDYEDRFKEIRLPVLSLVFSGDNDAPPVCAKRILKKLSGCSATYQYISEKPDLGHNGWARNPMLTAAVIDRWLTKQN